MTVSELYERMDPEEFTEWQHYFSLEPWGPEVESWRAGMIASTIANVNRGKGKPPFKPADFMPRPPRKAKQTAQEMLAVFRAAVSRKHG